MSHALELRRVDKRFGATRILRGIDLAVAPGECVAVIGPNGAGKSTLFDAVSGRVRCSAGEVLLAGRPITGMSPQRIRRRGLARSFQISQLFGTLGAREHLHCALAGAGPAGWSLLRPFGGAPAAEARVQGLLDILGLAGRAERPAAFLTYAEQRLLEIGMAFCGDPAVVLLDEPTAGMSQDETLRCTALIRGLAAGRTVLVIEHDMQVVFDLADKVAVLVAGEIIAFGTPASVRADPAVRRAYAGI